MQPTGKNESIVVSVLTARNGCFRHQVLLGWP